MAESTHGSTAKLLAEISNVLEDGLPRSVDEIVLNPPVIAAMRDLTEALMKSSNKFQLEGNGLFKLAPVAQVRFYFVNRPLAFFQLCHTKFRHPRIHKATGAVVPLFFFFFFVFSFAFSY
jgi:hypothetical protein